MILLLEPLSPAVDLHILPTYGPCRVPIHANDFVVPNGSHYIKGLIKNWIIV